MLFAMSMAAPRACSTRAATSSHKLGARPQKPEPMVNTMNPREYTRLRPQHVSKAAEDGQQA